MEFKRVGRVGENEPEPRIELRDELSVMEAEDGRTIMLSNGEPVRVDIHLIEDPRGRERMRAILTADANVHVTFPDGSEIDDVASGPVFDLSLGMN